MRVRPRCIDSTESQITFVGKNLLTAKQPE